MSPHLTHDEPRISTRAFVLWGLAVSAVVAGLAMFFASDSPDGLEHVAQSEGFASAAHTHAAADAPFADYQSNFLDGTIGMALAAIVGFMLVGLLIWGVLLAVGKSRSARRPTP